MRFRYLASDIQKSERLRTPRWEFPFLAPPVPPGNAGDGGVDGIIDQDHLGLDRIYVQAKRYAEGNTVGSGAIRVSSAV
jgi:hypothetical protein